MWAIWLIVGVVLLIAEMLTLTFYLLWLGIGGLAAGAVALVFPDSFAAQGLAGGMVALVLTLFTKPLTRKLRSSRGYRDPVDEMIGKTAVVVEDVEAGKPGIVKVGGDSWSAVSHERLRQGETVEVVGRGTTMLEVQKRGG